MAPGRVLDGRSLLELLDDPGAEWGRDILIENGKGANRVPTYRGIRTYRFLYVEHRTTGEYELYDLEKDPYQLNSVDGHARYAKVQRDLRSRLRQLTSCVGLDCLARPHLRLTVRSGGRPARGCVTRDLRIQLRGSKRARLVHADVLIGRRRVERLVSIPTAHRRRTGPDDPHRRGPPQADPPLRPLPPPRARGDGRRPQAHDRPDTAALPLSTTGTAGDPGGGKTVRKTHRIPTTRRSTGIFPGRSESPGGW